MSVGPKLTVLGVFWVWVTIVTDAASRCHLAYDQRMPPAFLALGPIEKRWDGRCGDRSVIHAARDRTTELYKKIKKI
jgi:hypothetical protein